MLTTAKLSCAGAEISYLSVALNVIVYTRPSPMARVLYFVRSEATFLAPDRKLVLVTYDCQDSDATESTTPSIAMTTSNSTMEKPFLFFILIYHKSFKF